jgi:hypothetical protein
MNKFELLLKKADIDELKKFLISSKKSCYESKLLKITFKNLDILNCDSLSLFQNHFVLFHILYRLQNYFQNENKFLYIHFMRTILLNYPEKSRCRFFNEKTLSFCNAITNTNKDYCDFHFQKIGDNKIEELSSKYFYLDKENFFKLNKKTAEKFINGTWEILSNYDNYKNSYKILDLPESASIETIKKRFRTLAKKYHPDHNKKISKEFNEINNAYQFLLKMQYFQNFKI